MASRLYALGGHVTRCKRRALHLGVQKALGVVASHYQVDLEAVSTGYVVPVGVDDEVTMNRADALAAPAADIHAEDFTDFLFPDDPTAGDPEARRSLGICALDILNVRIRAMWLCNEQLYFKTFESVQIKTMFFTPAIVFVLPPDFLR
jgi:hypothetical protein